MDTKLEITVKKTIEALARIERFVEKYGPELNDQQIERISAKLQELHGRIRDI